MFVAYVDPQRAGFGVERICRILSQLRDVGEPVPTALAALLDQAARFQGGEQAEHSGLVHAELIGDLRDAGGAAEREHLEFGDRSVNRLDRGVS